MFACSITWAITPVLESIVLGKGLDFIHLYIDI
jgi:hypothetical protein